MTSYFDQMILSATPVELIRLLYQKAIAKTREAREHLRDGRIEERAGAINLVYRILTELTGSVDASSAPELALRLTGLYCYMQARLVRANTDQADAPLTEVLGLLMTLSEAWVVRESETWTPIVNVGEESARVVLTA